jgi:hypothetical protein
MISDPRLAISLKVRSIKPGKDRKTNEEGVDELVGAETP